MTTRRRRSCRLLVAVFCSIGVTGLADGLPATWLVVPLAAMLSALLLPALAAGPALAPATVPAHGGVAR